MKNVLTEIVAKNLCCGCGLCAGVTKHCGLAMSFNKRGELVPSVLKCNDCGLCLDVCPFNGHINGKSVNIESPLGEYLSAYVGHSLEQNERAMGSSGGLVTRILSRLLEQKKVDGVVIIGASARGDRFFEPVIVRRKEDLLNYAGSKYYPVEFSQVLDQIRNEEGFFAFVGLPCVIDGLRLIQKRIPAVGRKIKYTLGLVCGHNKNKNYTNALLHYAGSGNADVQSVMFRSKDRTTSAINYGFKGSLKDGSQTDRLFFQDSIVKDLWCGHFFSLPACFHCKDLFAARADMSFMDAWLKPYVQDPLGTSIIIVRNNELAEIMSDEITQKRVVLDVINKSDILLSQQGALDFKRRDIYEKQWDILNMRLSNTLYSDVKWRRKFGLFFIKNYIFLKRKIVETKVTCQRALLKIRNILCVLLRGKR